MHEGEGFSPSEIDRIAAHSRDTINRAMQLRHEVTDRDQRHAAGNAVWRAHCVLDAIRTLDTAFPRAANHDAPNDDATNDAGQTVQDSSLSTSESRALLATLKFAQTLAKKVDAQRSHTLPENMSESIETAPGETRGADFAESVGELVLRLRGEIFGGNGRD